MTTIALAVGHNKCQILVWL